MEKHICKNVTHVSRCITELQGSWNCYGLIHAMQNVLSSLSWESICTSLRYIREATKQEVTYPCRPMLACRAVSSHAATSSLPRKLWSPSWEKGGARIQGHALWLYLSPGQCTDSRNICLLPWLIPKLGKLKEMQEDVALKKQHWQRCS